MPVNGKVLCMVVSAAVLTSCAGAPPVPPEKPAAGSIVRLDPVLDTLVSKDARIEKVAGGFQFTEGPLWRSDNRLWFSDVVGNVVRSVTPDGQVTVLIEHSGGSSNPPAGSYLGSNGMAADKDGSVMLCQHAARRIVRVTKDMKLEPVVEKFEDKRLNSPNDLVLRSDGSIYFTDPPFGLLQTAGHIQAAGNAGQRRLGRGRQDALHHGRDGRVPHEVGSDRVEAGISVVSKFLF